MVTELDVVLFLIVVLDLIFYLQFFGHPGGSGVAVWVYFAGPLMGLFSVGFGGYVVSWRLRSKDVTRDVERYSGVWGAELPGRPSGAALGRAE